MDVVQYARDKQIKGGVPLSVLCAPPPSPVESPNDSIFITNDRIIKGKFNCSGGGIICVKFVVK